MKITGGTSRGRSLTSLKGLDIRPTSSKVREAIFNLLGQDMSGIHVIDLFAGTGILGIEALSRGAVEAIFVDKSSQSISIINKNLTLCGYNDRCSVLKRDIAREVSFESLVRTSRINLAFIDPPYRKNIIPDVLKNLSINDVLAHQAVIVAESEKNDHIPEKVDNLILIDSRLYGETKINIYRNGV
jgi:16S rRNA (guanine966-N2)-methyltransferase